MMSDSEIIAELRLDGSKAEDFFLIGNDIFSIDTRGRLISMLVENQELHDSIVAFLRRRSAKEYTSIKEFKELRSRLG